MVVVNAMEGEPASAKDRVLLEDAPHLVLDGAEVAAAVVGASEIVICVPDHAGSPAASIEAAIAQRKTDGQPSSPRLGATSTGPLCDRRGVGPGRMAREGPGPSRLPESTSRCRSTCGVVRRWCTTPRRWPRWPSSPATDPSGSAGVGTPEAPGSTLVTVSGAVTVPGVVEVELGTPVVDIVRRAGIEGDLSAVLVGGYGGAWLDASRLSTPYAPAPSPRPGPPSASVS